MVNTNILSQLGQPIAFDGSKANMRMRKAMMTVNKKNCFFNSNASALIRKYVERNIMWDAKPFLMNDDIALVPGASFKISYASGASSAGFRTYQIGLRAFHEWIRSNRPYKAFDVIVEESSGTIILHPIVETKLHH